MTTSEDTTELTDNRTSTPSPVAPAACPACGAAIKWSKENQVHFGCGCTLSFYPTQGWTYHVYTDAGWACHGAYDAAVELRARLEQAEAERDAARGWAALWKIAAKKNRLSVMSLWKQKRILEIELDEARAQAEAEAMQLKMKLIRRESELEAARELVDLFEILSPGQIRFLGASLWGGNDRNDEDINRIWDEVRLFCDKADAMIARALAAALAPAAAPGDEKE